MKGTFSESFSWEKFSGKIYWGTVLHGGLMIRSYYGQGSFRNVFSSDLKNVNLKMFANHEGIYS